MFVQEFTVHCEDYLNDTGASLTIYMDGRFMERQGSAIPKFRGRIRGVQTSAVFVRPFRFSDIPVLGGRSGVILLSKILERDIAYARFLFLSDTDDAMDNAVNYDTLGLIELQIHRVQLLGYDPDALVTRTATEVSPIPQSQNPPMDLHCIS